MAEEAHVLGPRLTLGTALALTRATRSEALVQLADQFPHGCVLALPHKKILITGSADTAKRVLVEHPDRYIKGMGQLHARQIIGDGLLTAEGETWRVQRDAARPHLRARAVHERLPAVVAAANASAERISRATDREADLTVPLAEYTLACLALQFDLDAPSGQVVHDAFEVIQDEAIFRAVTQGAVPLWVRPRKAVAVRRALHTLNGQAVRARRGGPRPGQAWTSDAGMLSLFLAGYETTASTLAWATMYLAHAPDVQGQLAEEGRHLASLEQVTVTDLTRLTHSMSVFQETLRLRPPVWLISRRATTPDRVAGTNLRPGDEVLILPGAGQGDRTFDPADRADQSQNTLAFGSGPRACPGIALASMEATIWLATVAHRVELFPARPGPAPPLARMSQSPAHGALVRLRARTSHPDPQEVP